MANLDPIQITVLVMNVMCTCMKENGVSIQSPNQIDLDKKFGANRPEGYGVPLTTFLRICDCMEDALSKAMGRPVVLPAKWRIKYYSKPLGDIVSAIVEIVIEVQRKPKTLIAMRVRKLAADLNA